MVASLALADPHRRGWMCKQTKVHGPKIEIRIWMRMSIKSHVIGEVAVIKDTGLQTVNHDE